MPSHSLVGFPDGIGRTGSDAVSVGGTGVLVGVFVGVLVGSGVFVDVGRLVAVGKGVSVGLGPKVLQAASVMIRTENIIALLVLFIYSLSLVLKFITNT